MGEGRGRETNKDCSLQISLSSWRRQQVFVGKHSDPVSHSEFLKVAFGSAVRTRWEDCENLKVYTIK